MKELCGMTKEELIGRCRKLQSSIKRLEDELEGLSDCYSELENRLADEINYLDERSSIFDVDDFKWRLRVDDMLTPQLESFIENYLKFYNRKD